MSIKILLVDDHCIVREGLRSLIEAHSDFCIVGEASDGREAIAMAKRLSPDLVLMDITLPEMNGIAATYTLTRLPAPPRVMILSMRKEAQCIASAFHAGACGYLVKDDAFREITDAIKVVMEGKRYLSNAITDVVVDQIQLHGGECHLETERLLTPKEFEVLQLLAEGKSTKEIAFQLNISPKTVDTHRQKIMQKLSLNSIAELTKYAVRHGLTPP